MFKMFCDESAGTSVEYAVMLALIIAGCFLAVVSFGSIVNEKLSNSAKVTGS